MEIGISSRVQGICAQGISDDQRMETIGLVRSDRTIKLSLFGPTDEESISCADSVKKLRIVFQRFMRRLLELPSING